MAGGSWEVPGAAARRRNQRTRNPYEERERQWWWSVVAWLVRKVGLDERERRFAEESTVWGGVAVWVVSRGREDSPVRDAFNCCGRCEGGAKVVAEGKKGREREERERKRE